jgi:hypothetical protein
MSVNDIEIFKSKISETDLEDLLIKDLTVIEEGLTLLGHQIPAGNMGTLDILAMDDEGSLTVIELKVEEKDTQLVQGIRYLDWAISNLFLIAQTYKKEKEVNINTNYLPRLILVAPSYSENLKTIAKYICPYVNLYDYTVIKYKNLKKVLCREIDYGEIDFPEEPPTIKGHTEYIDDINVRQILTDTITQFTTKGVEIHARKRSLSLRFQGSIIGRIRCRRDYFRIISYLVPEDEREYHNINSKEAWEKIWAELFESFL